MDPPGTGDGAEAELEAGVGADADHEAGVGPEAEVEAMASEFDSGNERSARGPRAEPPSFARGARSESESKADTRSPLSPSSGVTVSPSLSFEPTDWSGTSDVVATSCLASLGCCTTAAAAGAATAVLLLRALRFSSPSARLRLIARLVVRLVVRLALVADDTSDIVAPSLGAPLPPLLLLLPLLALLGRS